MLSYAYEQDLSASSLRGDFDMYLCPKRDCGVETVFIQLR